MKIKTLDKVCQICGDSAVGRNFGAITCESCKAFFRRNSLRDAPLNCNFESNCTVEVKTRKLCKKCRLEKCLSAGMRKEFIQNKEQKELRRTTIQENKRKKAISESQKSTSSTSSEDSMATIIMDTNQGITGDMLPIHYNSQYTQNCDNIFEINRKVQSDVLQQNGCIARQMMDRVTDANQNFLLYLFTPLERPVNTFNDWNNSECKRLSDLCLASNVFRYPSTQNHFEVKTVVQFYQVWGSRLEVDAKNIVQYTKDITKYECDISDDDKITLIKHASMELIILRANYCWDEQAEKWTIYMDDHNSFIIYLNLLKYEKRDLFNNYRRYFNKILPDWNWDSVILDLLTAIVFFNPNRPDLINRDTVRHQQELYIHLLQRYLMLRFRWEWQWRSKFANLMSALIDLKVVSEIEVQNGVELYMNYFGPIFKEIVS